FTYVDDIVAATRMAGGTDLQPGTIYNIGGGSQTSVREALEIVSELGGRKLNVTYGESQQGEVRDTSADTRAARRDLGFEPATTLREGLAAEFTWMKESLERGLHTRR